MPNTAVTCSKCQAELPADLFNRPEAVLCPQCQAPLLLAVFPARRRPLPSGGRAESTVEDTEASCFYHPQKRAIHPCDACGRFLCALCDCDVNGMHLCPGCLEAGQTKGKIQQLENRRVRYDNIALALAALSFVPPVIYFCWLTAPLSIYLAIRHWNSPLGIVHRSKARFVWAVIIGVADIALIFVLIFALMGNHH